MRSTLLAFAFAFATAAVASPHAQAQLVTTPLPSASASPNATTPTKTRSGHRNPHKEPTPSFKQSCQCETPIIPAGQYTPSEVSRIRFKKNWIVEKRSGSVGYPSVAISDLEKHTLTYEHSNASSTTISRCLVTTDHKEDVRRLC